LQLIDEVYEKIPNIGQNKSEITNLAKFVQSINPKNILEIGTQFGGTFYLWCKLASNKCISLDLPNGIHGGIDQQSIFNRNNKFLNDWFPNKNITFISANSHKQETFDVLFEKMQGEEGFDFLFIDGDHTYDGVKQDYEMYRFLIKSGGYIAFHDINNIDDCGVDKLWKELKGEKIEFNDKTTWVKNSNKIMGGIGIIKNE